MPQHEPELLSAMARRQPRRLERGAVLNLVRLDARGEIQLLARYAPEEVAGVRLDPDAGWFVSRE